MIIRAFIGVGLGYSLFKLGDLAGARADSLKLQAREIRDELTYHRSRVKKLQLDGSVGPTAMGYSPMPAAERAEQIKDHYVQIERLLKLAGNRPILSLSDTFRGRMRSVTPL